MPLSLQDLNKDQAIITSDGTTLLIRLGSKMLYTRLISLSVELSCKFTSNNASIVIDN